MAFQQCVFFLVLFLGTVAWSDAMRLPDFLKLPSEKEIEQEGTHWAVLIAGSSGYGNYRHQVGE
jgi:glycosylphosphatidylinositol transamidase (GPIT) subunit GPI8